MSDGGTTPAAGSHVGPYRLVEWVGGGGMGEVWRAADDRSEAASFDLALKLIAPDRLGDPDSRTRFKREVEAAQRVESDHVARVVAADPDADPAWLASRYVEGPTLAEQVEDSGPLADDELRALGIGLARGLDAIHKAGVVHRDLTPGNVVLGADGPVIVDFGVSRLDDATTITSAGSLVGTPAWMAPEQLRDDQVSDASDIWAWGAVMAYASTARPPVAGERTETVIARVLDGRLDLDDVRPWLRRQVVIALDAEPTHRPTADELVARLARSGLGRSTAAVTRSDPVTEVAPAHARPTVAAGGDRVPARRRRDWSRLAVRALIIGGGVVAGLFVSVLLAVVVFTIGLLLAVALRIWTEERRDGAAPMVNAASVFIASLFLLAASLSSVIGLTLAVVAVVALIALVVAVGVDIG